MVLATVTLKLLETDAPVASVAVTINARLPTSPFNGVPLKVRVVVLNDSQLGSGSPLASEPVRLEVSPTSTSAKVFVGMV